MIVENKDLTLQKANDIANNLLQFIGKESKEFNCEDDPAEHIYLMLHIAAILNSKICMVLEEQGKTYGIDKLTCQAVKSWIEAIGEEYLDANKEIIR